MTHSSAFQQFCLKLDLKLTSLRREVLHILWRTGKPLKAYEILNELLNTKPNSKPPSVYRALSFLIEEGVVHKIESIQSYTVCCEPEKHIATELVMVCDKCHQVTEIHHSVMQSLVEKIAKEHQFKLHQDVIELKGACKTCVVH